MEFQNRVLTSDGRELLAQAISSNQRIIFVRAMSSTTYMDDTALVSLRVEDLTGPLGTIKTTSATGNVARIMTEFTNQPVSAKVKTVAVAARLAAQPDAAAIVMLAQSDPTAGIYIPSTAELSTSVQVAFNVVINATGEVEVTPSANVSLGDHERLLERTVTTHADGDPTVGENQTVYGYKEFVDDVHVQSDLSVGSDLIVTGPATFNDHVDASPTKVTANTLEVLATSVFQGSMQVSEIHAEQNYEIHVGSNIIPEPNDTLYLGVSTRRWAYFNCKSCDMDDASIDYLLTDEIVHTADPDDEIVLHSPIIPKANRTVYLGTTAAPFSSVRTTEVCTGSLSANASSSIILGASIEPKDNVNVHIGSSGKRISSVWAQNLHGILPNGANMPGFAALGAIVLVCVWYANGGTFTLSYDTEFGVGSNGITAVYEAEIDSDTGRYIYDVDAPYDATYHFQALCSSYGTGHFRFVLAMVIQTRV